MANSKAEITFNISQDSTTDRLKTEKLYANTLSLFKLSNDPVKKSQLQGIQETKEKIEKEFDEVKTALSGSCEIVTRLNEEYEELKKETETLASHDQIISKRISDLKKEYDLLAKTTLTENEELVYKTQFQYKCVRNITQVRFSYDSSNNDILEGYVFNKVTRKVSRFSINISKLDSDKVHESLMQLMKNSSHPDYANVPSE